MVRQALQHNLESVLGKMAHYQILVLSPHIFCLLHIQLHGQLVKWLSMWNNLFNLIIIENCFHNVSPPEVYTIIILLIIYSFNVSANDFNFSWKLT